MKKSQNKPFLSARRDFLKHSSLGALSLSTCASVIGVPASFLAAGTVSAATNAKFTILSQSLQGEPINCSGPMSFASAGNQAASLIDHPKSSELGTSARGTVNGTSYSGKDLEEPVELTIGGKKVLAARPWQELPQAFLNNLCGVWYRTGANAHPEMPSVKGLKGALRDDLNPNRGEELGSAIAWDTAEALGTSLKTPLVLSKNGMAGFSKGNPLTIYKPSQVKSLFAATAGSHLDPADYDNLYSQMIDQVYANVKQHGTQKQRAFLDNHALTRTQAQTIGDKLGTALDAIDGDDTVNQLRTAIAFIKLRLTPVVCVSHDFAGDNHSDKMLADEASRTLKGIDSMVQYWKMLNAAGLTDDINWVTLDCFGRTPARNKEGGRDHFSNLTLSFMHGSGIKSGMIGGLEVNKKNQPEATGIHSRNGSKNNPDIDAESTLAAYGKTVIAAAGVDEEKTNTRVPSGKVITAALV
ncbi:DUF1501 domain-containing protein [Marinagarivorans algicola]|uniref:DUF1501 domain-containing protein n=1 Tax=Marinagarivorans algicola TaxID=1513270 RepID=UPI003736D060